MTMLLCACRAYIAEPITTTPDPSKPKVKARKFLVMFRDGTGAVYLLDTVPPFLQDKAKRDRWFKDEDIKPSITYSVENGLLVEWNNTSDPELSKDVQMFLSDCNSGMGIAYLLAWGFVSEAMVIADRAAQIFVSKAGRKSAKDSAGQADQEFDQFMAEISAKAQKVLGLPSVHRAAKLAPAEPIAAPIEIITVDVEKGVVTEDGPNKNDLVNEAKSLSIPASKSWSIEKLTTAIAATKALAAAAAAANT
jgi:hypothetical protein